MPQGTQPRSWNGTTGLARRGALKRVLLDVMCKTEAAQRNSVPLNEVQLLVLPQLLVQPRPIQSL